MIQVHKNEIRVGDIVLHNGKALTVGFKDIKHSSFMGVTIFGDSYSLGKRFVTKLNLN